MGSRVKGLSVDWCVYAKCQLSMKFVTVIIEIVEWYFNGQMEKQ